MGKSQSVGFLETICSSCCDLVYCFRKQEEGGNDSNVSPRWLRFRPVESMGEVAETFEGKKIGEL